MYQYTMKILCYIGNSMSKITETAC